MAEKDRKKYRIQVPVSEEVNDAIADFAKLTGRPISRVCEDILTESVPSLYQIGRALEGMDVSRAAGIRDMATMMDRLAHEAKQMSIDLDEEAESGS